MSKELPYFKFYPSEWISGDITLESMELQGVFINVCGTYWAKECRVAIARLKQRYGEAIARLLDSGILKEKDGFAVIDFLNEQWAELSVYHQKNSENGTKGALARWGKNGEANGEAIALRGEEIRGDKKRREDIDTESELLNSSIWHEQIISVGGLKSTAEVRGWVIKFIAEAKAKDQFLGRPLRDLKSHCVSWIRVELSKKEKNSKFDSPANMESDYVKNLLTIKK